MFVRHAKAMLKQFASPVLDRVGLYDRTLRRMPADRWTIAMYHRVVDDAAADPFALGMCVTRRHFEDQLGYFRRHFTPISLLDAVGRLERGEPLPERAISITFDDGYLDNYTVALPSLQAQGLTATLFVPTGGIDDDQPLWWDRVIRAFDATRRTDIVPAELGIPMPEARLSLTRWQRPVTTAQVLDALWTLPFDRLTDVVQRIERALPAERDVAPVARRMSADQVVAMHRAGVEIGAHSVRHPNLTLESPDVVLEEMQTSRDRLQALCQAPIHGFAYPAGWKNQSTIDAARSVGFRYAVSTVSGLNAADSDPYTLSRLGMPDTPVTDLKRALAAVVQRNLAHGHGTGR